MAETRGRLLFITLLHDLYPRPVDNSWKPFTEEELIRAQDLAEKIVKKLCLAGEFAERDRLQGLVEQLRRTAGRREQRVAQLRQELEDLQLDFDDFRDRAAL